MGVDGVDKKVYLVSVGVLFLLVAVLCSGCAQQEGKPGITTFVGADYVGSQKCKECHAGLFEGWRETLHPYKVQDANERTVIGDFYQNNTLTAGGYTTRMYEEEGVYYVTTLDGQGNEQTYEVDYTLGGSQWKQRYLTVFPNGEIHILPIQWNMDTKEWVDYHGLGSYQPGDAGYWASSGRIWQYKCAGCHVTGLEINYDPQDDTFDTTWVDNGAGCEACHGPGSNHVEATTENKPDTIVNPDKTNFRMGAEVCGSCHNRGMSPDGEFGYPKEFLPGIASRGLDFTYVSVAPDSGRFWDTEDAKSHHQQYLDYMKSMHGDTGVGCWDCHDSHSSGESNRFMLRLPGSSGCKACHDTPREVPSLEGASHSIHDFGSCVDCHMPATAKSALPGDIRSHRFEVLKPEVTIEALIDGAMEKDQTILSFYDLEESDVEGLNRTEVEQLLEERALEAMKEEKPVVDFFWEVQPSSCYGSPLRPGCHVDASPWVLQDYVESELDAEV